MLVSRRGFLRAGVGLSAGGLGLSVLDACRGVAGSGDTGGVQLAWWGGSDRAKRTNDTVKAYEKTHHDFNSSGQFTAWSGYWQKLDTQAAGGGLPDIIQMDMGYIGQYTNRDQLLDLSDYRQALGLSDFDKSQLDQGTIAGKLYGVSLGGNVMASIYNASMIKRLGVAPPKEGLSWDDLAKYFAKLDKKLPSGVYAGDDISGNFPAFEVWVRQRGTELWTKDGKLAFTLDDIRDWFQYWDDLRKAGLIVPGTLAAEAAQDGTNQGTPLVRRKAVVAMTWSNFLGQYQILLKDQLAMMRLPTGGTKIGDYIKASMLFSLAAHTEKAEQSIEFVHYFIHNHQALKILGLERGVPGPASARSYLRPLMEPYDASQIDFFNKYRTRTRPKQVLDPPAAADVTAAMTRAAQSIPLSHKSVGDAAKKFFDDSQEAVSS